MRFPTWLRSELSCLLSRRHRPCDGVWFTHLPKWQDLSYLLLDSDWGGCRAFIYSLVHSLNKQSWALSSVPDSVLGAGIAKMIRMWTFPSRSLQSWQISGWDRCANRSLEPSGVSSVLEVRWERGECPWESRKALLQGGVGAAWSSEGKTPTENSHLMTLTKIQALSGKHPIYSSLKPCRKDLICL